MVYVALFAVVVLGGAVIATASGRAGEGAYDFGMRRRKLAMTTCFLAMLAMGGVGGVAEAFAQDGWKSEPSSPASPYDSPSSEILRELDTRRAEDAANGTWSALYSILSGSIPFFGLLVFAARRPSRGPVVAPSYQAYPGHYSPEGYGPYAGYAPNGYGFHGHAPHAHAHASQPASYPPSSAQGAHPYPSAGFADPATVYPHAPASWTAPHRTS